MKKKKLMSQAELRTESGAASWRGNCLTHGVSPHRIRRVGSRRDCLGFKHCYEISCNIV